MFDVRRTTKAAYGYNALNEHDACGIGACVDIKGRKSHKIVSDALSIVERLEHRAGKDAEGKTGDGVGIMTQVPHTFLKKAVKKLGIELGEERTYGVGMFFLPQDETKRERAKKMFEVVTEKENLTFLGWREVPVDPSVLGPKALECMPSIWQAFIQIPADTKTGIDFDRRLYVLRRVFEQSNDTTYVCSLSSRTIIYKGMFLVDQLRSFYKDLQDESYTSASALVHSRFSTNTFPSWERAHPYRFIVHNGEINTIRGNTDKMYARDETMDSPLLREQAAKLFPVVSTSGSDSGMLDNTLEFLTMNGMDLAKAVMITIPEPWEHNTNMNQKKKDFYQYYATMMEPWDGPASILFSDGDVVGAVLDRNGLRPSRYYVTKDGVLVLSSETGVLPVDESDIVKKDRLHPGKMLLVDMKEGRIIDDTELKSRYINTNPYGEWLSGNLVHLNRLRIPNIRINEITGDELKTLQRAFGYSVDEIMKAIRPMAENATEKIEAMGIDTALPMLNPDNHPLFHYFKQLFAQVTNPPIDTIREEIVTSTSVYLGTSGNLLEEKNSNCNVLKIQNPILSDTDLLKIKNIKKKGFKSVTIPITYYVGTKLEKALDYLFIEVDRAFRDGANIIILSDREIDENHVAIPSLLAVSALNRHLVNTRRRQSLSIILESGEPCEVHHFATLLGYGASAINPYLAHETIRGLIAAGTLNKDYYAAVNDYNHAVLSGIVKIAGKMGISTIQSYQGSAVFEAIGLNKELIDKYFTGTVCRIGGLSLEMLEEEIEKHHNEAFDLMNKEKKAAPKVLKEAHLFDSKIIHKLQEATWNNNYETYKEYSAMLENQDQHITIRSLLDFKPAKNAISLDEVESVDSIVTRFKTGAMSYGSISKEAHEALALAMNSIHGKSNTGEGGEDEERLASAGTDHDSCSAIKQVASGRFGVTSRYLLSAKEIQIKLAQGAKPGEGGHLPGGKVYPWIAKTRRSTPGVSLISPPPHHDIYSIEDLAELIYDLKNANRKATISVKLVSEVGVGTVAAGVAKAGAGVILISGFDGGTGAAPRNSISNAGLPWELGLAEAHQTLVMNGLRDHVRIETDGKLMTGRDVAVAAMLGAEEYDFATAPLVTLGCVMARVCNLDTCPMGIATQNPELRKRFKGKPEYVVNYMKFVAEELREIMAQLGIRTVDELVGRTDLLVKKTNLPEHEQPIDLSAILNNPYAGKKKIPVIFNEKKAYPFHLNRTLDEKVLLKKFAPAILENEPKSLSISVSNTDRAFGTILGSVITDTLGEKVKENQYVVNCKGAGGQSFGAFIPSGLTLSLSGDANDYFGKGLSGGLLALFPPKEAGFVAADNIIAGNVCLYGATSGKAFIAGIAGERFAVRNSGAIAVVEGIGDHGLEYMTGGKVAILGPVGNNFAAGMNGGIAYVFDENNDLYAKLNQDLVSYEELDNKYDVEEFKSLIMEHVKYTGSVLGQTILENFEEYLPKFKKVIPNEYRSMIERITALEERGLSAEQAEMEAFYDFKAGK